MRVCVAQKALVLGVVGVVALAAAGCEQQQPEAQVNNLKIVSQGQIDQNGAQVPTSSAAAPADPAGTGQATCPPVSIAVATSLSGPEAALGANVRNGVQLAVDRHNAGNPGCQVQLKPFDTENDPQKATQVAPQIVDDASILGIVGPTFSGETKATGAIFNQAGVAAATPGATNVTLSQNGWRTFFRGLANDGVQGPSLAGYVKNTLGDKKVCVVDDSSDFGVGFAESVHETLGAAEDSTCRISVKKGDKDFSAAVTQIQGAEPDAVVYAGYYTEAALLTQQLRDAGVTATFVSEDGSKDPEYVKQAGAASKDALLSCPCGPASGPFADEYTKKFGQEPGTYSTEAYDLGTIFVKGIDSGNTTRQALLEYVRNYKGQGVGRNYQWSPTGELISSLIWMYKVQ